MKTKVTNRTCTTLILKEGTGGIFRTLHTFGTATVDYNINVDSNATYREYWCASVANDPTAIVLSSDDCQEYKEVTIMRNEDGTCYFIPVRRDGKKADPIGKKGVDGVVGESQEGAGESQEGSGESQNGKGEGEAVVEPWWKRIFRTKGTVSHICMLRW
jgi:hypothetical protein